MENKTHCESVCVLGAGVVGLSTAQSLRSRGYRVVLLSAAPPSESTSQGAGGFWEPFECVLSSRAACFHCTKEPASEQLTTSIYYHHSFFFFFLNPSVCLIRCEPQEAVNRWAKKTLEERYLKELYSSCDEPTGSSRLVECVSVVYLHNNTEPPPSWSNASPFLNFRTVTSKYQSLPHRVNAAFGCFLSCITAVAHTC